MLHRKTIMFLALLGTYAAQAVTETEGYTVVEEPGPKYGTFEESETYSISEPKKATWTESEPKKAESAASKSSIVESLKEANKEGELCRKAAFFGRTLKVLPKNDTKLIKFSKSTLAKKCGDYFLGDNDAGKQHPQAWAAVTGEKGSSKDIEAKAKRLGKEKGFID
jgi:hypothetical protein